MKLKYKLARDWCVEEASKYKISFNSVGYCDPWAYLAGFEKAREMAIKEYDSALSKAWAAKQQQGYSGYPLPNFKQMGEEEVSE